MKMSVTSKNMQAKYNTANRKVTTDLLRTKLRQKFRDTLQIARRKRTDAKRFSSSDNNIEQKQHFVRDLRKRLLDNKELQQLITLEEIDAVFGEVQAEIGWRGSEDFNLYDAEVNAIVDSLLTICMICDQASTCVICSSCGNKHFTDNL